ncbi:MAG TPA: radical SAM protein [Candidatus Latescibacteria bacterium]|nr:radical SAM protein [Candidatus Latescibacterota bacterium]HJP32433.1 radical SAM protein [Candidatus Latescibacterota bacterium]
MDELRSLPVDEVVRREGVSKAIGIKHVASLLFSYKCTIACRHCLFSCSPKLPGVRVSLDDGVEFLRQLRQTDRVVHIAGGEAMMFYEEMLAICRAAREQGCEPHFFETNASWCVDDDVTRTRYEALRDAGLVGALISADPYHQTFVSPERRHRAWRWAAEIFGRENVAGEDLSLERLQELRRIGRDEKQLAEYTREHAPNLVGRAGESLSSFFPDRPLDELADDPLWHGTSGDQSCRTEFDADEMWEIHIDPYGNIQTCCGIIVGNAREKPLVEWMQRGFHVGNELVNRAYQRGPLAILEVAEEHGYEPREGYPQKCGLCWEVRKFLRPHFPETFGPAEIYELVE